MIRPNPKSHFHQCGRVRDGWLEGYGCRHMWQHKRNPLVSLVEDHACPACGKGPWYYELSVEEIESAQSEFIAINSAAVRISPENAV